MKTLDTVRLHLRPMELADAKTVQQLAGDIDIARTTLHIPHPYPDGAAEKWIQAAQERMQLGTLLTWGMTLKGTRGLIGCISLGIAAEHRRAEMGYWLGRPFWGQGYTTEAGRRLLQYGFEELDLQRIWAAAMTSNPASSRVMQKLGMRYEGCQRQHAYKWGEFVDLDLYGIVRGEYLANGTAPHP